MRVVALLAVAGCGFSEERFLVKGVGRWCDLSAQCAGTFTAEACVDVIRSTDRSGCDYDPVAGEQCFGELAAATCVEDDLLDVRYLDVPASCEATWVCAED